MRALFVSMFILTFIQVFSQRKSIQIKYPDSTISYQLYYKNTDSLVQNKLKAFYAQDTSILAIEKNYHYGIINGIYRSYYPNGSVNVFCIYQQGQIHGDWTKYDEFGNITIKAKFVNGQKHGFYINRKEKFQGRYRSGKKHGKWEYNLNSYNYYKRYYSNGIIINGRKLNLISSLKQSEDTNIKTQKIIQPWEEPTHDTVKINYSNKTESYIVKYINRDSLNHATMRKAIYQDSLKNTAIIKYLFAGKLSGNYKIYFPNGKLYKHLFYNYGVLHGDFKEFNLSGDLKCIGKFRNGKKHGKWKFNIGEKSYYFVVFKKGKQIKTSKAN